MSDPIVIRRESPDQPEVRVLLADLDRYLASLYEPEANHILDVQTEAMRLYEGCGYTASGAFGGYPDNGLSVFYGKAL